MNEPKFTPYGFRTDNDKKVIRKYWNKNVTIDTLINDEELSFWYRHYLYLLKQIKEIKSVEFH